MRHPDKGSARCRRVLRLNVTLRQGTSMLIELETDRAQLMKARSDAVARRGQEGALRQSPEQDDYARNATEWYGYKTDAVSANGSADQERLRIFAVVMRLPSRAP